MRRPVVWDAILRYSEVLLEVSKERSAFETSRISYPATQRHTPEDGILNQTTVTMPLPTDSIFDISSAFSTIKITYSKLDKSS